MTQETQAISEEKIEFIRPKFYRDKRFFRCFLVSFPLGYFSGNPFLAIVLHIAMALFWDWWFFSYKRVRESDPVNYTFLKVQELTKEQIDSYSDMFVIVRRVAFIMACTLSFASYVQNWDLDHRSTFVATYLLINLAATCYNELWKKDGRYPYTNLFSCFRSNNILATTHPSYRSSGSSSSWDHSSDKMSITNPIGYTNPCSPNYTGISMFDR